MEPWLEPLFDAAGMRAIDAWAIDERGVPSLELMEAAGGAVAQAAEDVTRPGPARVVCGKGNNGGDGLVAARHLAGAGHEVEVLLLWPAGELSGDAQVNLDRLASVPARELPAAELADALADSGVVVDAILGTGFSGAPRDPADTAIAAINGCRAPVVAADIASGVDASTGEVEGVAVEAEITVSFHAAKVGHLVAPGKACAGELRVAAIGIPAGAPGDPVAGRITGAVLAAIPRREAGSTKFSSGQVVVIGGSRGLTGAPCLSSLAATRAGAGYATVLVPADLEQIFEIKLTEVMSRGLDGPPGHLGAASLEPALGAAERADAVVLGPGLGRAEETLQLARDLATRIAAPLVIDADGLNAHAGALESLAGREAPTILTPHAGELGRLLDRPSAAIEARRLASAREAAELARAIVVLKGDDTIVAGAGAFAGDEPSLAANDLPSPGLATAGTGDVLSGMIAALTGRGVEPFAAACAAVHAHARAGRVAAGRLGIAESVIAGDVIGAIPAALGAEAGR